MPPLKKEVVELGTTRRQLTHWGRVTHICVGKLTIIGSDNGLLPERRQDIIWTNAEILLIGPLGTNFSEILNRNSNIFIEENTFENVVCEMLFISSRPPCVKIACSGLMPYSLCALWCSWIVLIVYQWFDHVTDHIWYTLPFLYHKLFCGWYW